MTNAMRAGVVTWQQAEDALTAAFEYLFALPDADRAFLSAGSRSAWPAIVRDRQSDYADVEASPSPQLTRRMMAHLDLVLTGPRAAALVVPEGRRALVGMIVVMKRWPGPDGFRWERVWERERGAMLNLVSGEVQATTTDAMRKAYERAIGRVARRLDALGVGVESA